MVFLKLWYGNGVRLAETSEDGWLVTCMKCGIWNIIGGESRVGLVVIVVGRVYCDG